MRDPVCSWTLSHWWAAGRTPPSRTREVATSASPILQNITANGLSIVLILTQSVGKEKPMSDSVR